MNKVMLIGNVGKEPDVRYFEADQAVAQVTLATTERGYTLQNGTQVPDRTEWHTVIFYRGLAKIIEKYVHKGDKLYVEGRIRYRQYDDQRGIKRTIAEILAENMELLTPKATAPSGISPMAATNSQPANQQVQQQSTEPVASADDDSSVLPF